MKPRTSADADGRSTAIWLRLTVGQPPGEANPCDARDPLARPAGTARRGCSRADETAARLQRNIQHQVRQHSRPDQPGRAARGQEAGILHVGHPTVRRTVSTAGAMVLRATGLGCRPPGDGGAGPVLARGRDRARSRSSPQHLRGRRMSWREAVEHRGHAGQANAARRLRYLHPPHRLRRVAGQREGADRISHGPFEAVARLVAESSYHAARSLAGHAGQRLRWGPGIDDAPSTVAAQPPGVRVRHAPCGLRSLGCRGSGLHPSPPAPRPTPTGWSAAWSDERCRPTGPVRRSGLLRRTGYYALC